MIKSELIAKISERLPEISEKNINNAVSIILEQLSDALTQGNRIEIRGFGSFSLHYRPPRQAHNPRTGEKVMTKPKYTPHFKPSKALRESVDASRTNFEIVDDEHQDDDE
jgi:integration host factor subunit beta